MIWTCVKSILWRRGSIVYTRLKINFFNMDEDKYCQQIVILARRIYLAISVTVRYTGAHFNEIVGTFVFSRCVCNSCHSFFQRRTIHAWNESRLHKLTVLNVAPHTHIQWLKITVEKWDTNFAQTILLIQLALCPIEKNYYFIYI